MGFALPKYFCAAFSERTILLTPVRAFAGLPLMRGIWRTLRVELSAMYTFCSEKTVLLAGLMSWTFHWMRRQKFSISGKSFFNVGPTAGEVLAHRTSRRPPW